MADNQPKPISKKERDARARVRAALRRAIKLSGGQRQLADACGYTQQGISSAYRLGRASPHLAAKIHAATKAAVHCSELNNLFAKVG